MSDGSRHVRTLSGPEVATLVGWAAAEGWNPGIGDAAAFRAADPEGFLGAFVDDAFVAGISAVRYGASFGFIGLYICRPEFRGRGHGRSVWDAGMARLAGRTIGLDGVPEQQANYAGKGFVKAYETVRLSGRPDLGAAAGRTVGEASFEKIAALDRVCFPEERRAFLATWIKPPRVFRALMEGGRLVGYGVLRRCVADCKIGPLFAGSGDAALAILADLVAEADGPVQIDVPVTQPHFRDALVALGMTPGFTTARMYRGPAPVVDAGKVFGITTLELG
ncbi:GNAT family N-acetyltransferase [Devosia sp. ZB163]|uniref:GNAT family N-acetyltransferase n=1 Tax=Devosia sp. ZB163 TaxID=3025938 RepID=UPI00236144A3|nr:GNAT family N-acetyltransferase [Devosia sp. ZB163]MDC9823073.1 GNAT family N-acetyltransferase [Devosia sp. ZB163]